MTNPQRTHDKFTAVVEAWTKLRPTKSFAGMTLDEFKMAIRPSLEARATIDEAEKTSAAAMVLRDNADAELLPIVQRVVFAVAADKDEGDNGELYKAFGYVRRSERASGLTRSRRKDATQPQETKAA